MSNLQIHLKNTNGVPTMSSLEIVELINIERMAVSRNTGKKYVEVQHRDFTRKIGEVIGEGTSAKFSALVNYEAGNGGFRDQKIYNLPQREACLMLMS